MQSVLQALLWSRACWGLVDLGSTSGFSWPVPFLVPPHFPGVSARSRNVPGTFPPFVQWSSGQEVFGARPFRGPLLDVDPFKGVSRNVPGMFPPLDQWFSGQEVFGPRVFRGPLRPSMGRSRSVWGPSVHEVFGSQPLVQWSGSPSSTAIVVDCPARWVPSDTPWVGREVFGALPVLRCLGPDPSFNGLEVFVFGLGAARCRGVAPWVVGACPW